MAEALTESFCERCGTRYEFKAPTRLNPLRKTRGFVSGLKNYIMSQDALSDAVGDAMRSEEEGLAAAQLDAFHESFNFCINCRQYTCVSCWNDGSGRCRTCAPIPGTDDLADRTTAAVHESAAVGPVVLEPELSTDALEHRLGLDAWPTTDLENAATTEGNGHAAIDWPAAELAGIAETEHEPVVAEAMGETEPEPMVAEAMGEPAPEPVVAEAEPEPAPEPVVAEAEPEPAPEPVVAEAEPELERVQPAWEDDFDLDLLPEPEPVVADVETEPEPVVADAELESEPEPVVAEAEREPVPRRLRPVSETILRLPASPRRPSDDERIAAVAETPEIAARRAQLDLLGLDDPGQGAVQEKRTVVPYRSRGAAPSMTAGQPAGSSFWDASAREVADALSHVGVQNCGGCGLSLSASARFCRRCGTRQARSA